MGRTSVAQHFTIEHKKLERGVLYKQSCQLSAGNNFIVWCPKKIVHFIPTERIE
jgi:hypothetical protein